MVDIRLSVVKGAKSIRSSHIDFTGRGTHPVGPKVKIARSRMDRRLTGTYPLGRIVGNFDTCRFYVHLPKT
jgi:hypothetical protein